MLPLSRPLGAIILVILVGCSSSPFALDALSVEFSADRIESPGMDPNVSVQVDESMRALEVQGFVTHGCSNPEPDGSAILIDTLILVTIRFDEVGTCATVPSIWSYSARMAGLNPGRYTVRVVQPVPDFTIPSDPVLVVFDEIVRIPDGP